MLGVLPPPASLDFALVSGLEYICKGAVSSVVRALASHARGHWFKSSTAHFNSVWRSAEVAEWQTRYVQGVVSLADVRVQIPPSAFFRSGIALFCEKGA